MLRQRKTACRGEASLLALAAAHQRLGWIHPFIDGNGRVMRLHTHAVLSALGYTNGLWSPLRGFARSLERYYSCLADADSPRRGDLVGRGNLSEQGLLAWIDYVLDVCFDQVRFMEGCSTFPQGSAELPPAWRSKSKRYVPASAAKPCGRCSTCFSPAGN